MRLMLVLGRLIALFFAAAAAASACSPTKPVVSTRPLSARHQITGELRQWHRVTITFDGPQTSEDARPNPFTDYRLIVTFVKGAKQVRVHGFYAADGNAANSGASAGNKWRVHFAPDEVGEWTFTASFRSGPGVAVSADPTAGAPAPPDGESGRFTIGPTDKTGRDLRAQGYLQYVGKRYLQFAGSKRYFIKAGPDSPETFLAYHDFDGTFDAGGIPLPSLDQGLHRYAPHLGHWRQGDPMWRNGLGKGIVGAINYIAGKGMNVVYFTTMNVGGDGQDVWPWVAPDIRTRFDCSKLDQWEIVFGHMEAQGIMLHFMTQETENEQLLDGGTLGAERRLYYRELIARFGHHMAITWNLGEENRNPLAEQKAMADFFRDNDPYGHPVVVHTYPKEVALIYTPLLGHKSLHGTSIQMSGNVHAETLKWIRASAAAGHPWVVAVDEWGGADFGTRPDSQDPGHDRPRRDLLWANLMAGGAGIEIYFGWQNNSPTSDLSNEDWANRDLMWTQAAHALAFFNDNLPFAEMESADELVSKGALCLAKPGEIYAVYLPQGGMTDLDLAAHRQRFQVQWFDPRQGGALQRGSVSSVLGGGRQSLGSAPGDADRDWVVLVTREPAP
jgi:hypothetical protein